MSDSVEDNVTRIVVEPISEKGMYSRYEYSTVVPELYFSYTNKQNYS